MDRSGFTALIGRLADAWNAGDAEGAAACFTATVAYADPTRYAFSGRESLLPFFDPGPDGHHIDVHRVLFDEHEQTGVVEYTYAGEHRYHGAAIAAIGGDGLISTWREWQHIDDARDWAEFIAGRPG
ncbi:MAG: nuclear transport factor 2 family protein [Chloroflexota bacterium]